MTKGINYSDVRNSILNYYEMEKELKKLEVWNSNRPFHTDFGEWLTEKIFGYSKLSRTNSDGDFKDHNWKKIEVKTVRRAPTNPADRVDIKEKQLDKIDEVIIIWLNDNYSISKMFRIPKAAIKNNVLLKAGIYSVRPNKQFSNKEFELKKDSLLRMLPESSEIIEIFWA